MAGFDVIAEVYHENAARQYYDALSAVTNPLVSGRDVLDVGNGGVFSYDPSLPRSIVALDRSPAMLAKAAHPNVTTTVDDARTMHAVPDCSADVIVFGLVLHHITGRSPADSRRVLAQVLATARRKLRPHGRIIVAETTALPATALVQAAWYPLMQAALDWAGVGMIYFHREEVYRDALARYGTVETHRLDLRGWFDPFAGSFPGLVKVPSSMSPTRNRAFVVTIR